MTHGIQGKQRWWALMVLCLGVLMIVLDTTIVNVALPSIREDLHFTETSLVWVVNAYMLTFGGFLLLGGRLGDLLGHRRMFLAGLVLFTVASLGSGFKGGEVTPLFYIGATLGNALAPLLQLPFSMLAGLGFVAVFAGAANTPIATIVMAIELFGPDIAPFAAIACIAAYLFSGHSGIYHAQRVGHAKHRALPGELRLSELGAYRKRLRQQSVARTPEQ